MYVFFDSSLKQPRPYLCRFFARRSSRQVKSCSSSVDSQESTDHLWLAGTHDASRPMDRARLLERCVTQTKFCPGSVCGGSTPVQRRTGLVLGRRLAAFLTKRPNLDCPASQRAPAVDRADSELVIHKPGSTEKYRLNRSGFAPSFLKRANSAASTGKKLTLICGRGS